MTDRELLELIAAQVGSLTNNVGGLTKDVSHIKEKQDNMNAELSSVKRITLDIEQDHGKRLDALFDGYIQNTEQLNRIEKEVTKHEEIILRRIKWYII